jgi:hypothetical protein
MDPNKNQLNQILHSTNLAAEDLIADSQISTDLTKSQQNDLPQQISSAFSIRDQNIEISEKLKFTHNENFRNSVLTRMKDNDEIFKKMKDLVVETNYIHAENFSNKNILRNENIEILNEENTLGDESFENEDVLMMQTSFAKLKISSKKNLEFMEDIEISPGVQSEKDCSVLGSPLVRASAPSTSECFEGSSPVIYFESLTPELALAEETWSINLEEVSYSNEERESTPSPRVVFKEKKKILINRLKFDDEPYISSYSSPSPRFDNNEMIHLDFDNSTIEEDVEKAPNEGYNLPLNGDFAISENAGDVNNDNESIKNNYKVDDNINMSNDEEAFINGFSQLSKSMPNIPGAN